MKESLHYLLMANHFMIQKALVTSVKDTGLTSGQPKVLDYLKDHNGAVQKDIAAGCHIEPASLTAILNGMETKGLIERRLCPDNHRFYNVYLTETGRLYVGRLENEFDTIESYALQNFSEADKEQLIEYLSRIYNTSSFALLGFPFLSGYYSKDLLLELSFANYTISSHFAYILGTLAAFCTAFYSMRLLMLTFIVPTNAYKSVYTSAHDAPLLIALPLTILSIFSIFVGYFFREMAVGFGSNFWNNALFINFSNNAMVEAEFLPFTIKILPVVISLLGLILATIIYEYFTKYLNNLINNNFFRELYMFLNKIPSTTELSQDDKLYSESIYQKVLFMSYNPLYAVFDKGIFNVLGPRVLNNTLEDLSTKTSEIQTGFFYHYALIFLISITLLIIISSVSFFNTLIVLFVIFFFVYKQPKNNK